MRQYLAAVAGLFAAVGFAAAQAPKFTPAGNFASPADAAAVVQQVNGSTVVANGPGCSACGPTARHSILGRAVYGPGTVMPINCSCLAAENTFFFGSCSQFFNPSRYCGGANAYGGGCNFGGNGGGCGAGGCGGREKHPCQGVTSYLNR